MSSGCGDVLSLQDLQVAKTNQLFEAEVITGKQGGVAGGADIDYATNQNTGQTQKTLPATLRDAGFHPASFTFTTGGTLSATDADKVVYDPVSKAWYSWGGTLPKVIPAATNPLLDTLWKPQTDPILREDLADGATASKGAGAVAYSRAAGYAKGTVGSALAREIYIDDFIPSGVTDTATTDCSVYIQNAVKAAFSTFAKLIGTPGRVYAVGSTVLIPQNFDSSFTAARPQAINGNGCTFRMLNDITLFESGYYNSNTLVTNFGTADDSHYSKYISLGNFTVISGTASNRLSVAVLRIQDWHHSSKIHDIYCNCASFALHSHNNYYMEYDNLCFEYPTTPTGDRFVFSGNNNLNIFRRLIATNAAIQYRFDGPVTAAIFDSSSVEGATVGLQFNAEVSDMAFTNNYVENVADVAIFFATYVHGFRVSNNYVNYDGQANMKFLAYTPTPATGINIDASNYFSDESRILKTVDNTYGQGLVIERASKSGSSLKGLQIDSSKFGSNLTFIQRQHFTGFVGNTVNTRIPGNYAGKFTDGLGARYGFDWQNFSNTTLLLKTAAIHNSTELMYINIVVSYSGGTVPLKGLFMGGAFYKFTTSGVVFSSDLALNSEDAPYVQIQGSTSLVPSAITNVVGEIRLI